MVHSAKIEIPKNYWIICKEIKQPPSSSAIIVSSFEDFFKWIEEHTFPGSTYDPLLSRWHFYVTAYPTTIPREELQVQFAASNFQMQILKDFEVDFADLAAQEGFGIKEAPESVNIVEDYSNSHNNETF
jgi:hypothetical protein